MIVNNISLSSKKAAINIKTYNPINIHIYNFFANNEYTLPPKVSTLKLKYVKNNKIL